MMQAIATFLMFTGAQQGNAEAAVRYYTSIFPDSSIDSIDRWQQGDAEPEGTIRLLRFRLNGVEFMASENSAEHAFGFTPAISLFVECASREELLDVYHALVAGGQAMMPPDDYGFSRFFAWVSDRYGVSWQLNLAR